MFDSKDSIISVSKSSSSMSGREQQNEAFSSQSILNTVQDFVSSVNTMNQVIMVPTRLMDLQIKTCDSQSLPEILRQEKDPHLVYGMLNHAKNELLNGVSFDEEDDEGFVAHNKGRVRRDTCVDKWAAPSRRESTLSMMSVASSLSDDGDSTSSECTDSALGVEDSSALSNRSSPVSSVEEASLRARQHLAGLQFCLSQLSDSAVFITELYREEMNK